jgi:DNA-binding transcriptional LysR family regulator
MNIELRHLRYFVAVAEEASFSAAARRVHVAQQVLSTQIRQLEAAVGAQLLRRTSRGVVLTPAGAAFLDSARATLAGLERGVAAALHAAASVSGRREHVVAGHGISLCPASSEEYNARPGLVFVPGKGVPPTSLCVAWREGDERPVVRSFVELAVSVAGDLD